MKYIGLIIATFFIFVCLFFALNKKEQTLKPQKRFYPVQEFPTTEAAIYSRGVSDIYIAMSEPIDDSWLFRFHYSPLTPWIWIGSIMAFIGGILSFSHRMFKRK